MMKNKILKLMMVFLALVAFNACSDDDTIEFTTQAPPEQISFTNDFLSEYLLSQQTAQNNAERFVWMAPDFGVPTPVTYQLQGSTDFEFTEPVGLVETTNQQASVSVGQLIDLAEAAGLDNDPGTENPNTGELFFRVRAQIGTENAENSPETISEITTLTVTILEAQTEGPVGNCDNPALFIVGAGAPDAGWNWNSPVEVMCSGDNVYTTNVLLDADSGDSFRFFTEDGNWDSGINYPAFVADEFTIDERLVDAEDGDNNFLFTGETGIYFITVDYENKTITLSDPQPIGDCGEVESYWLVGAGVPDAGWNWNSPEIVPCNGEGIYRAYVRFSAETDGNNFRFFTENGNWDSGRNYPYFINEGYTIDERFEDAQDGDNNFAFIGTSGSYIIEVDSNEKTITLQ